MITQSTLERLTASTDSVQDTLVLQDSIAALGDERIKLQDFTPVASSLEWTLAKLAWDHQGVSPFAIASVPFYITSSGRLSRKAALLLFDCCGNLSPDTKIEVLELGAGSGLFARFLLDNFKALCIEAGTDYYQRLNMFVSDGSAQSVKDWQTRGIFEQHQGHVTCIQMPIGKGFAEQYCPSKDLMAIYCNYVLDVLPYSVIQYTDTGFQELQVRTTLSLDPKVLPRFTQLSKDEIEAACHSKDPQRTAELVSLAPIFERTFRYAPIQSSELIPSVVRDWIINNEVRTGMAVNHGAVACLHELSQYLRDEGHVLINDYGPVSGEEMAKKLQSKRYGHTLAMDINFPILEFCLSDIGFVCVKPNDDDKVTLHSRLLLKTNDSNAISAFERHFSLAAESTFLSPFDDARELANQGRRYDALNYYQLGLPHCTHDWFLLAEVAEFLRHQLNEPEKALPLIQHALKMNPWYSTWLWDILGDCYYAMGRQQDAHAAYNQALSINPKDSASNLRLACAQESFGRYEAALQAIAVGLANDREASQRQALLDRQQQILAKL